MAMKYKGTLLTGAGYLNDAISNYYKTKGQEYQLKSKASTMSHQAQMQKIQAEQAEFQARTIMEASQKQINLKKLQSRQIKGAAKASLAARGVQLGYGSAAEIIATTDYTTEVDALTINANAVMEAEAAKMRAKGLETSAMLSEASAETLLTSADALSPMAAALGSFASGIPDIYQSYKTEKSLKGNRNG